MNRYLAALLTFAVTMVMATLTAIMPSPGGDLIFLLWIIAVGVMVIWEEYRNGGES